MNRLFVMLCLVLLSHVGLRAQEAHTYYFQLICGSDRPLPAKGDTREVGPKLRSQLEAKFRWKNYAEISRGQCTLSANKTTSIKLPENREMQLQLVSAKTLEARLYRGRDLVRKTRENASSDSLIMGGDQGRDESWFIVIRRDRPSTIDTAQVK